MQEHENLSKNMKWTWVPNVAQKSPFMMLAKEFKTSKGSRVAALSGLQGEEMLINVSESRN